MVHANFSLLSNLTKYDDSWPEKLSEEKIKEILYKLAGTEKINKFAEMADPENIGIDIYDVDAVYVLRKV